MAKQKRDDSRKPRTTNNRLRKRFNAVAQRAARLIEGEYPRVIGVVVDGSVGRGEPLPHSDVDVLAIVESGKTPRWFSYLDGGIHVSIGFLTAKQYETPQQNPQRFFWARGSAHSARILYDCKGVMEDLVRKRQTAKVTPDIVEGIAWKSCRDIVEYLGKLRNGRILRDEYLIRYAAMAVADNAQEVVIALNDLSPLTENAVWYQVADAVKKPRHFSVDFPISRGLKGGATSSRVVSSAERLGQETLDLLDRELTTIARNRRFRAFLKTISGDIQSR